MRSTMMLATAVALAAGLCGEVRGQGNEQPTQLFEMKVSGGSLRFGPEAALYLVLDAIPMDANQGTVVAGLKVTGPTGEVVSQGQLTLDSSTGYFDIVDLRAPAVPGSYSLRFEFPDGVSTHRFTVAEGTTLTAPDVHLTVLADGSVRIFWDAVPGARGYWADLYRHATNEQGQLLYALQLTGNMNGRTSWDLPAGTLAAGNTYATLVYALDIDPRETPLPESFTGAAAGLDGIEISAEPPPPPPPPPGTLGDLNGDGRVTVVDVLSLLRIVANLVPATDDQKTLGDLNQDGRLDIRDALALLRQVAGLGGGTSEPPPSGASAPA